jgi:hypothetical protein
MLDCANMKRLFIVVILAIATVGAVVASASSRPSAAPQARAASHSCGTLRVSSHTLGVTVIRGRPSCTEARKVLGTFLNGKATLHPHGANSYWTVGNWRCLPTPKGWGACTSGGTNPRTSREYIEAAGK